MALSIDLDTNGYAVLPRMLSAVECRRLRDMYSEDSLFRSRVDMARYRFGLGEYKYMQYPLPPLVKGNGMTACIY